MKMSFLPILCLVLLIGCSSYAAEPPKPEPRQAELSTEALITSRNVIQRKMQEFFDAFTELQKAKDQIDAELQRRQAAKTVDEEKK